MKNVISDKVNFAVRVWGVKEEGSQLLVLSQLVLCILESSILKSFVL